MRSREVVLVSVLTLSALLGGCVLSVEPFIADTAAITDPRLLGEWEEADGSDRARISQASATTYAIEFTTGGKVGRFEGRLGRMGERSVLDVWPVPRENDLPPVYADVMFGGHSLFALDLDTGEMRIAALDADALDAAVRTGRLRLSHARVQDRLLLRGTTGELRSVLEAYLRRAGAFAGPSVWRRARGPAAVSPLAVDPPCFEASPWPQADQLFHRDPHWLGADVASSADLGAGRTLWLFGDSWIHPQGTGSRTGAKMVSNTVGVQTGADPSKAAISFYWGRAADGSPDAFFPDRGAEALWLGNAVRVEDRLVLFFARTLRGGGGLGFHHVGWTAVMVENPDAEPPAWRVRPLETPPNPLGVLVGFAAVLADGEYVYAFGSQDPVKSHPLYAVRWPSASVRRGDLLHPEWWAGERFGWVPDDSTTPRWPLFENGGSELSLHFDKSSGRYISVQTQGFGSADLVIRAAPALAGPWSATRMLYRPGEYYRPNIMIYAGKAHPELAGADLVLTYATNSFHFADHLGDSTIYYPRFVRLSRCAATAATTPSSSESREMEASFPGALPPPGTAGRPR